MAFTAFYSYFKIKEKNFDEYKAFIINKKFNEFNYNTEKIKINIFIYYKYLFILKINTI